MTHLQLTTSKSKDSYLDIAAMYGNPAIAEILINAGMDVNIKDNSLWTPVHTASFFGHLKLVKKFCERGADLSLRTNHRATPLHFAADEGGLHIVEYLVGRGADLKVVDNYGWTPLHYAVNSGSYKMVEYLVKKGSTIDQKSKVKLHGFVVGATPVYIAEKKDYRRILKLLQKSQSTGDKK